MSEVRCPPKSFKLEYAGATRARWCALIPSDHTVEDVMHPNYFGRLANTNKEKLRFRDIIECEWEDGTKFGELTIRVVEPTMEQVVTAVRQDFMEIGTPGLPTGWTMGFVNPTMGWTISFNGDEKEKGFSTPEAAAMRVEFLARQAVRASVARPAIKAKAVKPAKVKTEAEAEV